MARAQKRDAARVGKFFFRKDVFPPGQGSPLSSGSSTPSECGIGTQPKTRKMRNCFSSPARPVIVEDIPIEDEYEEMSIQEIFCGKVCDSDIIGERGVLCAPGLYFPRPTKARRCLP